jgi:hypothetical protein
VIGTTLAEISHSRDEAERPQSRSVLCLRCHDAVTTPIPVASASSISRLTPPDSSGVFPCPPFSR